MFSTGFNSGAGSGRQQHQREIVWHDEVLGAMPSGPVHQHAPMGSRSHGLCDFRQPVQAHRLRIASGSTKAAPLPCCRNRSGLKTPEGVSLHAGWYNRLS